MSTDVNKNSQLSDSGPGWDRQPKEEKGNTRTVELTQAFSAVSLEVQGALRQMVEGMDQINLAVNRIRDLGTGNAGDIDGAPDGIGKFAVT